MNQCVEVEFDQLRLILSYFVCPDSIIELYLEILDFIFIMLTTWYWLWMDNVEEMISPYINVAFLLIINPNAYCKRVSCLVESISPYKIFSFFLIINPNTDRASYLVESISPYQNATFFLIINPNIDSKSISYLVELGLGKN